MHRHAVFRLSVIAWLCSCGLFTFPVYAQPVPPGEEGALGDMVAPEEGARACFARRYDPAHLSAHPQQKVTAIRFHLAYFRHDADDFFPQGQRNYYFETRMTFRDGRTLATFGECRPDGNAVSCGVDCDGGGFALRPPGADGRIRIDFGENGRLVLGGQCGEGDNVEFTSGEDDRVFLLSPVAEADCPAYENW